MCVIILHEKTRKGEIRLQIHQVDESVPRRQRCDSEAAVVCTPANSVRTAFVLDLYYTPNPMQTNQCRFINELLTVGFRFRPLHCRTIVPVAKRNGYFPLRTKTNIRIFKLSEHSYSSEYSFLAEYSIFCRIFGHFNEYLTNFSHLLG